MSQRIPKNIGLYMIPEIFPTTNSGYVTGYTDGDSYCIKKYSGLKKVKSWNEVPAPTPIDLKLLKEITKQNQGLDRMPINRECEHALFMFLVKADQHRIKINKARNKRRRERQMAKRKTV